MKLILASSSPRRVALMNALGMEYEQIPSNYEEDMTLDLTPEELVKKLSLEKAKEVATRASGLIIASDTMVFCEDRRIGKPKSREECVDTLQFLRGKTHHVISGVTFLNTKTGEIHSEYEKTAVTFREFSDEDLNRYADSDEPYDKAAGYAIQGMAAMFIERVEGCYTNIVGFPVPLFVRMLKLSTE